MLITKDLLIQLIKDYLNRLLRQNKEIVAAYLTGSMLQDDPLLGGSTDIDLVIVHKEDPAIEREIRRVKSNLSFDIIHHHQSRYTFHRRMRQDAWLGYALRNHDAIMYDTDHWLEYIQAGVDSQYDSPENTHARALKFSDEARRYWFELDDDDETPFSEWLNIFFKAVGSASNAIAALSGPGLTQRRFMLEFPARAEAVNQLPLVGDLARLIGNDHMSPESYQKWRPTWELFLDRCSESSDCPPNLHKARKAYFLDCCDALIDSGRIHGVLWPMFETWRQIDLCLGDQAFEDDEEGIFSSATQRWHQFAGEMGFTPENKAEKAQQLGAYIEKINSVLEDWQREYGL